MGTVGDWEKKGVGKGVGEGENGRVKGEGVVEGKVK